MKSLLLRRIVLFAALGVTFFLVPATHAQNTDSVRVVRLSRAEGQVLVSHTGSNVWEEAPANLPLQEGDTLATQGGFAEMEFENGATGYLAENSVLQFSQLGFAGGGRATELTLTQGAGRFYANLTSQDIFRVHALTFDVSIPDRAEFRVDGFQDGAAVEVFLGAVTVSTARGSTDLEKGQSVAVHQKDFNDLSIGSLPTAEDAFDQLVNEEGERIRAGNKNTLSYVNSPNIYGFSDLAIYGTWLNIPGFGFSWRPFGAGLSFTPFLNGHWILDPRLGWIWLSNEQWGWTPYHFGSWLLAPGVGWVWVPGGPAGLLHWDAARVNWLQAGGQVAWVAKSPNDTVGAPANIKQGVVTRPLQPARNGNVSNELLTGKGLQTISPVKQPPQEFASHAEWGASGATRPETKSAIRIVPRTLNDNPSIVLDGETHTFINRDAGGDAGNKRNAPVAPAAFMPPNARQTEIPRVTNPATGSMDSRTDRVLLPRPYSTAPASRGITQQNVPASAVPPTHAPLTAPKVPQHLNVPPSPVPPSPPNQSRGNFGNAVNRPAEVPRPASPPQPSAPPRPASAPQPSAPHAAQGQSGSPARPGTPAQQH